MPCCPAQRTQAGTDSYRALLATSVCSEQVTFSMTRPAARRLASPGMGQGRRPRRPRHRQNTCHLDRAGSGPLLSRKEKKGGPWRWNEHTARRRRRLRSKHRDRRPPGLHGKETKEGSATGTEVAAGKRQRRKGQRPADHHPRHQGRTPRSDSHMRTPIDGACTSTRRGI